MIWVTVAIICAPSHTPRNSAVCIFVLKRTSSSHSIVPFDDASEPTTRLVRKIPQGDPKEKGSELRREISHQKGWKKPLVIVNEPLHQSELHGREQTIWRILDAYNFREDFVIWQELVNIRRRVHGSEGIRLVWKAILERGLDLPVVGVSADTLWTQCLELGFEDPEILKEVFIYARKQKDFHGRTWPKLYATVLRHHLRANYGRVWLCHLRLHKHFPPSDHQFRQLLPLALPDGDLRQLYLKMHESFPYVHLYDFAIPQLCNQGLYATAAMWHEKLIRRGDYPSDARKSEPVLNYLAVNGDKNRLMEYIRLMVEAGVSFAVYRSKNVKIPPFISRDIVMPPLGYAEEIPEKKFSDGFCARLFATRVFSLDTVISSLDFLGAREIGSQALREMATRELSHDPYHRAVQARLDQLRDTGISTGDSTFSVVVSKLAAEGKDNLLKNVISCDLHSDTFDNYDLQESLLSHYQEQDDTMAFERTLIVLTAKVPERFIKARRMNYVLRAFLTRRDLSAVTRTIASMWEQSIQVEEKSTMHMRKTMLCQRNVGRRPASTNELDLLIRMWQDVLRSGVFIPPNAWIEILRRLGMCGRLHTFERLALWLAAWYSSPAFRASQASDSFKKDHRTVVPHPLMSLDLKPSNPLHPLQTLFPRSLQQGIVAWGFQHVTGTRKQQRLDWTWGLLMLRKLRIRNVHILTPVIAKSLRTRLLVHDMTRRKARLDLYIRKAKEIWGKDLKL
ncbi:MAG: hypothetical protein Q9170_004046 [Blastenia crenularia]